MLQLLCGHEWLYSMKHLKERTHLGDIGTDGKIILNCIKIHRAGGCGLDKLWAVVNKAINVLVLEVTEILRLAEKLSAFTEN